MSGKAGATAENSSAGAPDHSGSPHTGHGNALIEGLSTAFSWLTILPVRGATQFDRTTGRRAMAAMPVVGIFAGIVACVVVVIVDLFYSHRFGTKSLFSLSAEEFGLTGHLDRLRWSYSEGLLAGGGEGSSPLAPLPLAAIGGFLILIAWECGTRLMHIDGLADIADALGSYQPPEKAREILADPHTGSMGVCAIVFSLGAQWLGLTVILTGHSPIQVAAALIAIPFLGRVAACTLTHHRARPASATGFGSLVIGTTTTPTLLAWWLALTFFCAALLGIGAVAICLALAVCTLAGGRHLDRRLGGLGGDCLGATIESAQALAAILLTAAVV